MRIAVIIPTFNEKENIKKTISNLFEIYRHIEVVVIDDNSPDQTSLEVEKLQKIYPHLHLIRRKGKGGRGSAVIEGLRFSYEKLKSEIFVEMDADVSHNPKELTKLVSLSASDTIVLASRYLKESKTLDWPIYRRLSSRISNFLIHFILGLPIKDNTNGYRVYPHEAVKIMLSHQYVSHGYILLSESAKLLYKKGFQLVEVPSIFVDRKLGKSNATFSEFINSLFSLLNIRLHLLESNSTRNFVYFFLLAAFLFVSYFDLIKQITSVTFGNDLGTNWIYAEYLKKAFNQFGQYALWHTGFLSGFPASSSNLAAIFYPFHLLFLFLPLKITFNLLTLFHVYLIGVFGFLLAKYGFKQSKAAAFLVALSLMLSPKFINHNYLGHFNLIESVPWLILSILLFIKSIEKKSWYFVFATGLVLALIINVFSIFYVYALFALGLYLLFNFSFKSLFLLAGSIISSLFFASIFLLPFLEFSPLSLRTGLGFWDGAFPALYWESLPQLLNIIPEQFHNSETLIYIGLPTLLLAALGLFIKFRNKAAWFLLALSLFALTVSLGANAPFYKIYYRLIPVFHYTRAPVRIWTLFIISVGVLSGFGWEFLVSKFPQKRVLMYFSIVALIFISLWIYNKDYLKFTDLEKGSETLLSLVNKDGRIYCLDNCLADPISESQGYQFSSGGEVVLLSQYNDFARLAGGLQL